MSKFTTRALTAVILAFLSLFFIFRNQVDLQETGKTDLRAYWGASFLLWQEERFNDHDSLMALQLELTGMDENRAQMTWNPPWILVLFIPLAQMPFDSATLLWIFINFFIFIWCLEAVWAIWYPGPEKGPRKIWLYAFMVMFYPFWNTIAIGQITTIVLLGLVGSVYFADRRPFLAGMCLSLVTAKPHLVLITLPLLLVDALYHKRWKFLAGFGCMILLLTGIGFWLRPELFVDYLTPTGSDTQVSLLFSPFLPFLVSLWFSWVPFRFVGVLFVPIALYIWYRDWKDFEADNRFLNLMIVAQLFSLLFAPYGFTFDHVTILPIVWVVLLAILSKETKPLQQIVVLSTLLIFCWGMMIITIFERGVFDLIMWLPFTVGLLYWYIKPFDSNTRVTPQISGY